MLAELIAEIARIGRRKKTCISALHTYNYILELNGNYSVLRLLFSMQHSCVECWFACAFRLHAAFNALASTGLFVRVYMINRAKQHINRKIAATMAAAAAKVKSKKRRNEIKREKR